LGAGIGVLYSGHRVSPSDDAIRRFLTELAGAPFELELETIAGGASPRKFHRARPLAATAGVRLLFGGADTAIVMEVPPDTPDVAFARELGRSWPFLEVRALLEAAGVRVPRVFAEASSRGLLLVEDLGKTLAEHLSLHAGERDAFYALAVRDLARAQSALDPLPKESVVRLRAFDEKLLGFELDHFWEWGLGARGKAHGPTTRAAFESARTWLIESIGGLSRGFVHRDYQSRNLLVTPGRERSLGWIDFQDALLGPRAYDLVALLCDSYQPFDRAFVDARLDDYAGARGLSNDDRQSLGREFDVITVQRKLKDAGRFVFIDRKRGDPSFLEYVEPTLGIVRQALDRLGDVPELRALRALLNETER
jgi:aminoglycoside/choline kinase family phosphotransferase